MKSAYLIALVAQFLAGANAQSQDSMTIALFSDTNCQTPVPGTGQTTVNAATCDTGPFQTGWSSAKLLTPSKLEGDQVTFYNRNDCGCPTCGSHAFAGTDTGCLTALGFTANAVGYTESSETG